MKKIKENSLLRKSIPKINSMSTIEKHNQIHNNSNNHVQSISNALCICSKCHKLCLIPPEFWVPPVQNSPRKSNLSNIPTNYQIFLDQFIRWEYTEHFNAFKQNSYSNNHFLFPCCPNCFNFLIDQIRSNNDFYVSQKEFLDSTEKNSLSIKKTYLSKVETDIGLLKQQSESMKEIINDKKHILKKDKKLHLTKRSQTAPAIDKEQFIPCILNVASFSESEHDEDSDTKSDLSSYEDDNNNNTANSTEKSRRLNFKDEYVQSQGNITFSYRSLGFCGISLCLAFHITSHNHYGCINGMRIGTMTPNRVPTNEFDQGLFFLAQLIKCIASIVKVEIPNLVITNGIFLYEEIKYDNREESHSKAATTDALSNGANVGKGKIKMKLFEKPKNKEKPKEKEKDSDKEQNNEKGEMISLSTMTKYDKRLLSGSADSLKPRFYSSESVQLTANDLKTSRGVQIFRKAMSILLSIVYRVLNSSIITSQFNFAYELQNGGSKIHGISFDYNKQNPSQFTYAMKLLLFNLKSIQLKALEDDVARISDEF